MRAAAVPSLTLWLTQESATAQRGESSAHDLTASWTQLTILEILSHQPDLANALEIYRGIVLEDVLLHLAGSDILSAFLAAPAACFDVFSDKLWGHWGGQSLDLLPLSRERPGLLGAMARRRGLPGVELDSLDGPAFRRQLALLEGQGLVAATPTHVDLADLRRLFPIDPFFGWSRGAPVDRYYLKRFIERVRPVVGGRCLEVGAKRGANDQHGFAAETYQTIDLTPGEGDLTGDVTRTDLFAAESWDTIIALHVLEHCQDPRTVVENFHRWLSPGGRAIVQVPAVQRIHKGPGDYVRFMPDGLRHLFCGFSDVEILCYGNPLAIIAGTMGLSWHELTRQELDFAHADFPLVTSAVARKQG